MTPFQHEPFPRTSPRHRIALGAALLICLDTVAAARAQPDTPRPIYLPFTLRFVPATYVPSLKLIGQLGGGGVTAALMGQRAVVALGPRLVIFDLADASRLAWLGQSEPQPQKVEDIDVSGTQVAVALGLAGLRIYDLSNPARPRLRGQIDSPGFAHSVSLEGRVAYLADRTGGLRLYDTGDVAARPATAPQLLSVLEMNAEVVATRGGWAYLAARLDRSNADFFAVVDASDPAQPRLVWGPGRLGQEGKAALEVVGSRLYMASKGFLEVVDLAEPGRPKLIPGSSIGLPGDTSMDSQRDLGATGTLAFTNAAGSEPPAYSMTDYSNPSAPTGRDADHHLDRFENALSLTAGGDRLLVGTDFGLRSFNLSRLPSVGEPARWMSRQYGVADAEGTLLVSTGFPTGFDLIDISNPENLTELAHVPLTRAFSADISAGRLYVAEDFDGLLIYDLANPRQPTRLGAIKGFGLPLRVKVHRGIAYVMTVDGLLRLIDVTNPGRPALLAPSWVQVRAIELLGQNLLLGGESGVRILDLADPRRPTEVWTWSHGSRVTSFHVAGAMLYVTVNMGGDDEDLVGMDVTNPRAPRPLWTMSLPGLCRSPQVVGALLYASCLPGSGELEEVLIFDVANRAQSPRLVGPAGSLSGMHGLLAHNGLLFASTYGAGVLAYQPSKRALPSATPPPSATRTRPPIRTSTPSAHLLPEHPRVPAAQGQQLRMRAPLRDATPVDDHDLVRLDDRRQPVGDHQACAVAHQRLQGRLHQRFVGRVQGARRFVQDEDARVLQDGPGDGQPLTLPAREAVAPVARDRLVALRQARDQVVDLCRPRRSLHLFPRRVRPPVAQVLQHRRVEEEGLLRDHRHLRPQPVQL